LSPPKSKLSGAVLIGAAIVSIAWVAVWVSLTLFGSAGCEGATGDLWATHIACLSPNEIGDTFAGGFAPLALVWLMAAVLMQSGELRAQREELALTRQEMMESRMVLAAQKDAMDAQVAEARRNVEFIGQQTEFQREDREQRKVEQADATIETQISRVVDLFIESSGQSVIFSNFRVRLGASSVGHISVRLQKQNQRYHSLHTIHEFSEQLGDSFQNFLTKVPEDDRDGYRFSLDKLAEIVEIGRDISRMSQFMAISEKKREEFSYYKWEESLRIVDDVLAFAGRRGWTPAVGSTLE
jgi:hypothetical protein